MEKIVDKQIFEFLDYLSLFQLKYVNRLTYNEFETNNILKTLDLRNTKYKSRIILI